MIEQTYAIFVGMRDLAMLAFAVSGIVAMHNLDQVFIFEPTRGGIRLNVHHPQITSFRLIKNVDIFA
jgi:hypothetical protein